MRRQLFFEGDELTSRTSRFWLLLVLSAIIAGAGVAGDSTATVIGAMIVAPLMSPILGIVLAMVLNDRANLVRCLVAVVARRPGRHRHRLPDRPGPARAGRRCDELAGCRPDQSQTDRPAGRTGHWGRRLGCPDPVRHQRHPARCRDCHLPGPTVERRGPDAGVRRRRPGQGRTAFTNASGMPDPAAGPSTSFARANNPLNPDDLRTATNIVTRPCAARSGPV